MDSPRVIVIGSGVSGLTCAHLLAQAGHAVEVWARSVPPRTTSNVAAAFWFPYLAKPRDAVVQWARHSYEVFAGLAAREPDAGVTMRRAVEVLRAPGERPWWADAVPGPVTPAAPEQLPPGSRHGWSFEAPVVDTRRYLPWLMAGLAARGVMMRVREVATLDEALARAPCVVDCAGLGARTLAGDASLTPIRGQIAHVRNPGLTQVSLGDHATDGTAYVVPRGDDCVLGGTAQEGDDDPHPRPEDRAEVLQRCIALVPALAGATVLADVVGHRPGRPTVRVEAEVRPNGLVVHDYGHGGAGVTLSWGCARDVARLVARPRPASATG